MAKITQSLVAHEGKYIIMPPHKLGQEGWANMNRPNVHEAGGDTAQLYPVNCKFVDFDRRFVYGYIYSSYTSPKANCGIFNSCRKEVITFGTVAGAVGDTTLGVLTPTTEETTAAANLFAGGFFMPRTNPYSDYRIVSNTAYNGGTVGSTEMDIVIEEDGLTAIVAASVASCYLDRNPYTKLVQNWGGGVDVQSVVGVTLIDPTASTYQWIQVSGPVHVPGDENMGSAVNLRTAWWHIDGSIRAGAGYAEAVTLQQQYAGYAIGDTIAGTETMTWFLMMTPLD